MGTLGGGLHGHTHKALGGANLAGTTAVAAGLNDTVCRAGTVTSCAILNSGEGDFLLYAESRFLKGQLQAGAHIVTPTGYSLGIGAAGASAAKQIAKNITEVTKTAKATAETAKAAAEAATLACAIVGVNTSKAELVVAGTLVVIGQHFIGLAQLLELLLSFLIAGVPVGMVLHGLFTVGLLYFLGAGALVDPQHLIIVAFIFCHNLFTSVFREWDDALRYRLPHQCGSPPRCSPDDPRR